jgi:large subunit ribosomal protein L10
MAKELKRIVEDDLRCRFESVDQCILIDFKGINSELTVDLRATLRENGLTLRVVHNRLAQIAFGGRGDVPGSFRQLFRGPTAVLYGGPRVRDPSITASKIIAGWQKRNKDLATIKGGLLKGRVLSPQDAVMLGKLPDPEVLRASVAAMFLYPLQGLASAAQGLLSHFAGCAEARRGAAEAAGESK